MVGDGAYLCDQLVHFRIPTCRHLQIDRCCCTTYQAYVVSTLKHAYLYHLTVVSIFQLDFISRSYLLYMKLASH